MIRGSDGLPACCMAPKPPRHALQPSNRAVDFFATSFKIRKFAFNILKCWVHVFPWHLGHFALFAQTCASTVEHASMTSLDAARRYFADEIQAVANLHTVALVDALASVPRESFLGPGPWLIATPDARRPGHVTYRPTPDADPRHVYHNVLLAIDTSRSLNNGHPSTLAACLDALDLSCGTVFAHVGCGLGYYTALAAAVVGASGRVLAIDIDAELAARAARNLSGLQQVRVVSGDGTSVELPPCDAVLVNAGFTHPLPRWLNALREGGRLLLPITAQVPGSPTSIGAMVLVTRSGQHYSASPLSSIAIFASPTGRDQGLDGSIRQAFATGRWSGIRSLRRDVHTPAATCCVHGHDVCLSSEE